MRATVSKYINTLPNWVWFTLAAVGLFALYFFRLGSTTLIDVDEPRYAEAAREMLLSGNWITPYFNWELRFDKPIFCYWLIALCYKAFGVNEFAARFPSAVMATLTVLATSWFGARTVGKQFGWMAALVTATCIEFLALGRMSVTDMTLCYFMTLTTLALYLGISENSKWFWPAGIAAGLGILTKGPVALVVPGAVALLYALLTKQAPKLFKNRHFWLALGLMLLLITPWYVAAYLQNGQQFITEFFFKHNVSRYTATVSGHYQPWYFYFIVVLVGSLPWTPLLLVALVALQRAGLDKLSPGPLRPVMLFVLIWFYFTFTFLRRLAPSY